MVLETLYVLLVSATPVIELRGAIPLAIVVYDFSPWTAYTLAIIGNMIPPLLLIPLLGRVDDFISIKSELWRKTFSYFLERTRNNHSKKFKLLKEFALIILVAIPFPLTGAWTASLAAYIFGIPLRKAIPLILIGLLIAGGIVLAATLGIVNILEV